MKLTVEDYTDLITLDLQNLDLPTARAHWKEMHACYPVDAQRVADIVRDASWRRILRDTGQE